MSKKAADNKRRRSSVAEQKKQGSVSTAGARLTRDGEVLPHVSPMGLRSQSSVEDYRAEVDTDLYVGPVYTDDSARQKNVIKEQLGEITQRLHRTLNQFDTLAEYEENPHRVMLDKMSRRISKLESGEMKDQFESFLGQYQRLSSTYEEASKERDEILLDLADWFTADHTDLDHKLGIDEIEETDIKNSYVETLANFEKIKRLTESIKQNSKKGKNVKHLEEEKKKLEKNVVSGFKKMKTRTISIQTQKPPDPTWKYAADEIMSLITNVRTESSDELAQLSKKMREMLNEIERQSQQINVLQSENKRVLEVKKHLADENSELSNDNLTLRAKICRFEKDLESAKKMLENQFAKELAQMEPKLEEGNGSVESVQGKPKSTVSGIINQFFGGDDGSGLRRMSSDPVILRSRIRELDTNVDQLTKELVQLNDKIEEFEEEVERKEEETAVLQRENKHLSESISSLEQLVERLEKELMEAEKELKKAEKERLEAAKQGYTVEEISLTSKQSRTLAHNCSHCNCHLRSMVSIPMLEEEPSIPLEKKVSDAEIQRLMDKCTSFRRNLAETELKLSNAYRDIAQLRIRRESMMAEKEKPVYPTPEPGTAARIVEEQQEEEESEGEIKATEKGLPVAKITEREVSRLKEKPKKPTKPAPPPSKKEKETGKETGTPVKKKESPVSLPPLRTPLSIPREEPPDDKKDRDLVLWHVGDLQGKLNMVIQEIMDFVKAVGEVLQKQETEQASKLPTLTAFEFASRSEQKKKKMKEDPREIESKQRRAQVTLNGQRAVALMREIYDMLSNCLNLQHDEFEVIYRSFKANQHLRAIERAIMLGQLPPSALKSFKDLQNQELKETCTITSYGGGQNQLGGGVNQFNYLQGLVGGGGGGGGVGGVGSGGINGGGGWVNPTDQSLSIMSNESDRQKLEEAVMVVGMHRSKSDLDIQSVLSEGSLPSQTMMRERSSVFVVHMAESRAVMSRNESVIANREEVKVSKAITPKKGMIKLSSLDYELKNQFAFQTKSMIEKEQVGRKHRPAPQKMLIRRKDIAEQIKMGTKRLEEREKLEEDPEIEKQMGEYTFADLQMNIDKMTDASKRRGFKGKIEAKKYRRESLKEQSGLPQIHSLKPFGS